MESAELLGVEEAYSKGLRVVARLLGLNLSELVLETSVSEHSQSVKGLLHQKAPFPSAEEVRSWLPRQTAKACRLVRRETEAKARRGKGDKKTEKKEAIATAVYTIALIRAHRRRFSTLFHQGEPAAERPGPSTSKSSPV